MNTLGFVSLSAPENAVLEETTDREGFKATPHYQNFFEMLQQFVRFAERTHEFVRRSWQEFRIQNRARLGKLKKVPTAIEISRKIAETIGEVKDFAASKSEASPSGRTSARDSRQQEEYVQRIGRLQNEANILVRQVDLLNEQLADLYGVIGLGLLAEVLSHEIHNIADQLAIRNQQIAQHLKKANIRDWKIIAFTEHVQTTITRLRKQLSHLAPALRYVREKRDSIAVSGFLREIATYFTARLAKKHIRLEIKTGRDFLLSMNKGKLVQIVDNILLNSEYWLNEDHRLGHIETGVITVEVAKPYVRLWDNGRGIDPSVEASLFDPYVTTKGRGKGRGLGLFIVRQLLDSENCSIALLAQRNSHERLYIFEIDFTGGMASHD